MDPAKFSKSIQPLDSTILDLPPSCIEFVPGYPEFLVVGTYNLQKEVDTGSSLQSRTGSLILLRVIDDQIILAQTLSHPSAILDLHFLPDSTYFGIASSTGTISIYKFHPETHQISHLATHQAFDPALLVLSFTWFPNAQLNPLLVATLSNGSVHLLRLDSSFTALEVLNNSEPLNTHSLEAWTCAILPSQSSQSVKIYSGGDDSLLRVVEVASIPETADISMEIVQTLPQSVLKGHGAGVTAILPLEASEAGRESSEGDLLLTGSYDDYIRVYNTRDSKSGRGKALAELKIGGGVWRLKVFDHRTIDGLVSYKVLASCMHAGARVLEVRDAGEEWEIEVLGNVTIHESMCYGCDVQPMSTDWDLEKERVCVSTSFYDRLVCLWKYDPIAV